MVQFNRGSLVSQVESLQRQFAQAPGLPFADWLSPGLIQRFFVKHDVEFRDRDYPPLITLAMFLSQCHDADQSLRQAVARLAAHRVAQKLPACSSNTETYCKARLSVGARAAGRRSVS
jgi:hypothetical protein